MVDWRIAEALAVDTRQAVTRWWTRCRSAAAPIPDGLVDDLQAARLALDDGLQRRFWGFASVLREPRRSEFVTKIGEVDPWHVLSEMAAGRTQPDPAAGDVLRRVTVRERLVVFRARPVFASYLSGLVHAPRSTPDELPQAPPAPPLPAPPGSPPSTRPPSAQYHYILSLNREIVQIWNPIRLFLPSTVPESTSRPKNRPLRSPFPVQRPSAFRGRLRK
jgi:hypothetical protein